MKKCPQKRDGEKNAPTRQRPKDTRRGGEKKAMKTVQGGVHSGVWEEEGQGNARTL